MLYLNPPFYFINGVSIFSDHEDPLQFYFLPAAPHLTSIPDAVSGKPVPQLQLIEYRGMAGNGGFLNFDVNIGIDQNTLEDIRAQLRSQAHLHDLPRLAPVPLVDGSVQLMLLDKKTGEAAPPSVGGPAFVAKILQASKPALYGDNQATFSVQLTQDGVTIMEQALQGEMSPIGVLYALDYLALRPAYKIKLHADWSRVQHHFDESFGIDSIFTSVEIDKAIDELIESKAIEFEVDELVPEGEDTAQVIADEKQAEAECRDMITNAFFQPSLNPEKETKDGWDRAEHLMRDASAVAVTGGWAALGSFSYKRVDYTRIDQKYLNVTMSERTTVKRSIYPQGHLSGLFRPVMQQGIDLNRFILKADLDNPWFQRRKVNVISRADFDTDSVGSLDVVLHYNNQPENVILTPDHTQDSVEWASQVTGGSGPATMQWDATYSYKVTFKGVDNAERPMELESPEKTVSVENLEIIPRELYAITNVPIVFITQTITPGKPPDFPWDHYPNVEVHTRYSDPANSIQIRDDFLFDKDNHTEKGAPKVWKMFMRDPQCRDFQYRLVYHRGDGRVIEMPWVTTDDPQILVRDPFDKRRTLTVVPNFATDSNGKWQNVAQAFVDVSYEDPDNNIFEETSFNFSEQHPDPQTFSVDIVDPARKIVSFAVSIIFKDGSSAQIPLSYTLDRRILIRSDMKGHRLITIQPKPVDFASKQVQEITADLLYLDDANGLQFKDTFHFQSKDDVQTFEFDYVSEQLSAYNYQLTYQYTNGLSKTTDWLTAKEQVLLLPVS